MPSGSEALWRRGARTLGESVCDASEFSRTAQIFFPARCETNLTRELRSLFLRLPTVFRSKTRQPLAGSRESASNARARKGAERLGDQLHRGKCHFQKSRTHSIEAKSTQIMKRLENQADVAIQRIARRKLVITASGQHDFLPPNCAATHGITRIRFVVAGGDSPRKRAHASDQIRRRESPCTECGSPE